MHSSRQVNFATSLFRRSQSMIMPEYKIITTWLQQHFAYKLQMDAFLSYTQNQCQDLRIKMFAQVTNARNSGIWFFRKDSSIIMIIIAGRKMTMFDRPCVLPKNGLSGMCSKNSTCTKEPFLIFRNASSPRMLCKSSNGAESNNKASRHLRSLAFLIMCVMFMYQARDKSEYHTDNCHRKYGTALYSVPFGSWM